MSYLENRDHISRKEKYYEKLLPYNNAIILCITKCVAGHGANSSFFWLFTGNIPQGVFWRAAVTERMVTLC